MKWFIPSVYLLCMAFNVYSQDYPLRVIEVRVAMDMNLKDPELWKEKIAIGMAGASKIYKEAFNIEWRIRDFVDWQQRRKISTRVGLTNIISREVAVGDADIILGVAAVDCQGSRESHVAEAEYFRRIAVFYTGCAPEKINNSIDEVLAHEFGHLLGMFHVGKYMRSLMSPTSYSDKFDDVSKKIIALNRNYDFKTGVSSLSDEMIVEWVKIFTEVKYQKESNNLYTALIQEGLRQRKRKQFTEAEALFEKAILADPNQAEAYHQLGGVYLQTKRFQQSIDTLLYAINLDQRSAPIFFDLGFAYSKLQKPNEAITYYERAIRVQPKNLKLRIRVARYANSVGKYAVAERHFKELTIQAPDYIDAYIQLGCALIKQNKIDQAITVLSQALEVNPNHAQAQKNYQLLVSVQKLEAKKSKESSL